ncbi:MAG TPA: LPS export ABC transporter permease LptF [Chromatiales bacterium]|nr:LPS export ABC transporter permease LptF [Chromatiales bacterium]
MYLAILLGLTRLYRDNEMAVLAACGYGPFQVLRPVLLVAVLVAGLQALFSLWLGPWGSAQGERLVMLSRESVNIEGVTPGRFRNLPQGLGVVYVERINDDRTRIFNIFAETRQQGRSTLLVAESGHMVNDPRTGDRYLVLENGYRYEGTPGRDNFAVIGFGRHGLRIEDGAPPDVVHRNRAMPTRSLLGSSDLHRQVELQWRFSSVFACLVLAVLAVPLSRTSPRSGRYARLVLAVVVYLFFNNLLTLARGWLDHGKIPVALGLWWLHGVVLLLGLGLILWQTGVWQRIFRRGH